MSNCIEPIDFNLRAGRYFIAQTIGPCPMCRQATRLVAVGLLPGHEVLDVDDDAPDDDAQGANAQPADARDGAGDRNAWSAANHAAFLFHIAHLSKTVQSRMAGTSQGYGLDTGVPGAEACWANHCEHCAAPFDDQELFCEPGGAFLPVSEAAARRIHLLIVNEPLAADAAGYAHEPEFFDSMNRT